MFLTATQQFTAILPAAHSPSRLPASALRSSPPSCPSLAWLMRALEQQGATDAAAAGGCRHCDGADGAPAQLDRSCHIPSPAPNVTTRATARVHPSSRTLAPATCAAGTDGSSRTGSAGCKLDHVRFGDRASASNTLSLISDFASTIKSDGAVIEQRHRLAIRQKS